MKIVDTAYYCNTCGINILREATSEDYLGENYGLCFHCQQTHEIKSYDLRGLTIVRIVRRGEVIEHEDDVASNHTPTPWLLQEGPQCCFHKGNHYAITQRGEEQGEEWWATIAEVWPTSHDKGKADAEFIVRACNNHEQLLAVCKSAASWFGELGNDDGAQGLLDDIHAAIAKAKGGA